jgi:serine protease Do
MKTILLQRAAILAAALVVTGFAGAADETPPPTPGPKVEKHIGIIKNDDDGKDLPKEKVTFLGVEVSPVGGALAAQLGLKRGMGLVVERVVPESPAAPVLQQHDVLTKLNEQWLIDPHQLAVLVRSLDEGTEVTVVFVRGGKEQTAKVRLVKRELPRMTFFNRRIDGPAGAGEEGEAMIAKLHSREMPGEAREEMERVMRYLPHGLGEDGPREVIIHAPRAGTTPHLSIMALPRAVFLFKDDAGSVELRPQDGKRILEVRDGAGKVTFNGEITTPEQRAKLTPEVRARLEKVESMNQLEPGIPEEFETEERTAMPDAAPKIMFRARPAPAGPPAVPAGGNTL